MAWFVAVGLLLLAPGAAWAARRRTGGAAALAWQRRAPDLAGLAFLGLATLGFFWRVAAGQNWMPADGGDLVSFLYPTYRFAASALRAGAWPLWDPHLYAGAPHAADIQAGFLYPPNLLLFLLWPDFPYRALQWLSIGHVWFAGAGMYLFLAYGQGLRRVAALAGALAFMFSDALLVHFGNYNFNAVVSWMPWVFWAYLTGMRARANQAAGESEASEGSAAQTTESGVAAFRWAAVAGAALAVGTLAGHIQATLFILLALFFYTAAWLYLVREEPGAGRRVVRAVLYLGLASLVTALLAAPVLLPGLQLTALTQRAAWNYQEAAGYSVSPAQWIGLLVPNFFGRTPQFHWGAWPRVEVGYLGILPLFLAMLAVALRRGRNTWAWLAVAAVAFVIALGTYATPHGWLTLLPGFGQLRAPARLVFVVDFGLAALAAIGLDAALGPILPSGRAAFGKVWRLAAYAAGVACGVIVPVFYLALLLAQGNSEAVQLRTSITLIAILIFAGLLLASLAWLSARRGDWAKPATLGGLAIALIVLDLGATGAYQDLGTMDPSQGFRQDAIAGFLAGQPGPFRIDTRTGIEGKWQPDTALLYGLDDVTGLANPLLLADVERYWGALGSRSSRLYDLLNVRYIIAKKDVVLDWTKFEPAFSGSPDLNVYANRNFLPRAFVVSDWSEVGSHETAWQAIHAPDFDPARTAVIEAGSGPAPAAGGRGIVGEIATQPNGLAVDVTAEGNAVLVLSQVWYPGWQVYVDGARQGAPLRADYLFQAVRVPNGSHHVEVRFEPSLWGLGWLLAGGTLLVLIVGFVLVRRLEARGPAPRLQPPL